ncbi:hypothetical protein [Thermonema rossianum]|uniref:hypothetical protein n=1 Tax=Thermonema rossianum TaxID=55505 RepID=UPI0005715E66|nr:hypothetical protein [Thermonema rossianum]
MYFWSALLFVVVAGFTFLWVYARRQSRRYNERLVRQFEALKKQFEKAELQLRTQSNEVYPLLKTGMEGRALLIERTLRDKFNFFVINLHTGNPQGVHVQLIPETHYHGLKEKEKESFSLLPDAGWAYVGHASLAQTIAKDYLNPLMQQYPTLRDLFSTLVIYQQAITLVLFSSTKPIAYDKVLMIGSRLCLQLARLIEANDAQNESKETHGQA